MRWTLLTLLLLFVPASFLQAQESPAFRIETQIYLNDQSEPASENTTLFSDGLVFDYQSIGNQTHEVAILEPARRRIVLLDHARQVKLQLDELQLIKMADSLRKQTESNKTASFLVTDVFEESVDIDLGTATLTSPMIRYTVVGKRPADILMLPLYNQFMTFFTRMKFSDPHAMPPFARLRLNETISKLGWIPSEVKVKIEKNALFKDGLQAVSKHTLNPTLSDKDQQTITKLKSNWLNYKSVSLDDYRGLGKRVAEKKETH